MSLAPAPPAKQAPSRFKAILSLVLGLSSIVFMFVTGLAAILFGVAALGDVSKGTGRGKGMAITGIVLGSLGILWTIPVVLAMLLFPAVTQVRSAARYVTVQNNLRLTSLGILNYEEAYRRLPPAEADSGLSWRVHILPFMGDEERQLYDQFRIDEPWDSPHNSQLIAQMPDVYACPDLELEEGHTLIQMPYSEQLGPEVAIRVKGERGVPIAAVTDGTVLTVAVVEVGESYAGVWTDPNVDMKFDPQNPTQALGQFRNRPPIAACVDGHIEELDVSRPELVKALLTRAAGDNPY